MKAQTNHQSSSSIRRQHQHEQPEKLKPPPRHFFSCSFFRHCTQSSSSPTAPLSPPPQIRHPPYSSNPPLPPPHHNNSISRSSGSSSSSSSSSTSQSFTVWRFPPAFHHSSIITASPPPPPPPPQLESPAHSQPKTPMATNTAAPPLRLPPPNLQELFHIAELQFASGSDTERFAALHLLERTLVPNPPTGSASGSSSNPTTTSSDAVVPAAVMDQVVRSVKRAEWARSATKVLLALCLAEGNRFVAVARGAAGGVVEALSDLEGSAAERALAALELICMVPEGAAEVRAHALAVPMLVAAMGKMGGRGREHAISVLAVVFGASSSEGVMAVETTAPAEQVARAVVLAMQGGFCSERGKRKGAQLLKLLQQANQDQEENSGRLDLTAAQLLGR